MFQVMHFSSFPARLVTHRLVIEGGDTPLKTNMTLENHDF